MDENIKKAFIGKATQAAKDSGHLFPEYAACEAALESAYGLSGLVLKANNLFGMKAHKGTPQDSILILPTKEYINGNWITVNAQWMKYATWAEAFKDRMATLARLAPGFHFYAVALQAKSGEDFITNVSKTWSTDPNRAQKVLTIYHEFFGSV